MFLLYQLADTIETMSALHTHIQSCTNFSSDKLKRTPLMHAVMSGHAHIASFLLSLGASANAADSSNNTIVHYAAAYGWYFCLKLLLDSKADPNVANDWKVHGL